MHITQTNLGERAATPGPGSPLWGWGQSWSEVRALDLVTPHCQPQTASSISLILEGREKKEALCTLVTQASLRRLVLKSWSFSECQVSGVSHSSPFLQHWNMVNARQTLVNELHPLIVSLLTDGTWQCFPVNKREVCGEVFQAGGSHTWSYPSPELGPDSMQSCLPISPTSEHTQQMCAG